jgi:hypothetical protein
MRSLDAEIRAKYSIRIPRRLDDPMLEQAFASLPDTSNWSFEEIALINRARAKALELVGPPRALVDLMTTQFETELCFRRVRFGREESGDKRGGHRAVIQFGVGSGLFDWFFNGRTGYRAHFRAQPEYGLAFNDQIIEALRGRLGRNLPYVFSVRELNSEFHDCGVAQITKHFFLTSLVPRLSKVWMCTRRMTSDGSIEELAMGFDGTRVLINGLGKWAALNREDDSAWLDVKGAFLGIEGPYQVKDPLIRAQKLSETGEA